MRSLWLCFDPLLSTLENLQCKINTLQETGTVFDTATFGTRVRSAHVRNIYIVI